MQYAFIDESEPLGGGNGGPYLMVATLPLVDDLDDLRGELLRVKPRTASKLHWYEAVGSLRNEVVDVIARMPLMHWVVVVRPGLGERPERTRRACLELILWELDQLAAVTHVVFESRGAADDKRDMKMVQSLRASHTLTSGMRVDHVRGALEPLLWLPDAVCGAVNGRLFEDDPWAGRLDHQLHIVT